MLNTPFLSLCRDLTFCPTCLDLHGQLAEDDSFGLASRVQHCSCRRARRAARRGGGSDEADRVVATLCRCCGTELLDAGEILSVWFCPTCELRVDRVNEFCGGYLIPVGNAPATPSLKKKLKPALVLLAARDFRLRAWNLQDLELHDRVEVSLRSYLDALRHRPLDRVARFVDLCQTFGLTPETGAALARLELVNA
jgi:hypothetical protein